MINNIRYCLSVIVAGLALMFSLSVVAAETTTSTTSTSGTNDSAAVSQALAQLQQFKKEGNVPPPPINPSADPNIVPKKVDEAAQAAPSTTGDAAASGVASMSDTDYVSAMAFSTVTSRLFPLTTDQIVQLRTLYNANQLAQVTTPTTPPRPTATSQFVNLAPGSTPPVIRLSQGFVSSLVFLDSTGATWPIVAYDVGDPKSFSVVWDKQGSGNTLMIQANQLYTYGNLAIRLQGLDTPVMLTLIPGQKAVDYRVDLRIQGFGPNAKNIPTGDGLPPSTNSVLLSVLDGIPPPGGKLLNVVGGDAEAWVTGAKLYVRTRLAILSPGWLSHMSSADGMNAYEMPRSPVLLVSWRGKVMQLKIEGL